MMLNSNGTKEAKIKRYKGGKDQTVQRRLRSNGTQEAEIKRYRGDEAVQRRCHQLSEEGERDN